MRDATSYEFGPFRLDLERQVLLRNGERIPLRGKAFDLLLVLLQNRQQALTKEHLIEKVWKDSFVTTNNFNVTLNAVRKALGDSPRDPQYIVTTTQGYRLVTEVLEVRTERAGADTSENGSAEETSRLPKVHFPLGPHGWHILTACGLYASLYVASLLLEVSYQFDRYGSTALRITPVVISWVFISSIVALTIDWRRTTQGRAAGLGLSWAIFIAAALMLFGMLVPFLPSAPVTQAQFQTHTASAVYLKDIGYFSILATLFLILPFHFVVRIERELVDGNEKEVAALLTGDPRGVVPKGTIYIKPPLLGFLLGMITIWALIVRAYVLDQLTPGPYMNLFMELYYVRMFLFLGLPAYGLVWYYRAVNELKRQSLENHAVH